MAAYYEKLQTIAKSKYNKDYEDCTKLEKSIVAKQWIDENVNDIF